MPIRDFLHASGARIRKQRGIAYKNEGIVYVGRTTRVGVDTHLWAVLKILADQLKVTLYCSSFDTGKHAPASRHYSGRAVDISRVAPVGQVLRPFTPQNPLAVTVVEHLLAEGFKPGEGRPRAAILFGRVGTAWNPSRVPHEDHVHVSLGPWSG